MDDQERELGLDDGESRVLAAFPRTNKLTRATEHLRIAASSFQGRISVHLRIFFRGARPTSRDDGLRPSKIGVHLREDELDAAIAALEEVRRMVRAEGRATSDPYQEAAIRAEGAATQPADEGWGRPERNERSAEPPTRPRAHHQPREIQQDAFDEFAEYRK
jgi:hypothetical protein